MSKIIYYVAASQDGYIATMDHKLDWLENFSLAEDLPLTKSSIIRLAQW